MQTIVNVADAADAQKPHDGTLMAAKPVSHGNESAVSPQKAAGWWPDRALGGPKSMSEYETSSESGDGEQYECPVCGEQYGSRGWVGRHFKQEHGETLEDYESRQGEYSCPFDGCEKAFPTLRGRNSHHGRVHGESIAGVADVCEWCGDEYRRQASHEGRSRFCSQECLAAWQSENWTGENHPNYNRVELICERCGKNYIAKRHEKERSRFCSVGCKDAAHSEEMSGESNPNWKEPEYVNCEVCGEKARVYPSTEDSRRFCSRGCMGVYRSENWTGENSPVWNGGYDLAGFGPEWYRKGGPRDQALERDNSTCQICGMTDERHKQRFTHGIDVHHMTPRNEFIRDDGSFDHEQAHKLSNLITLCRACHGKWENIPIFPEVI